MCVQVKITKTSFLSVCVCVYEYGRACIYVFIGDFRDFPLFRVLAHNRPQHARKKYSIKPKWAPLKTSALCSNTSKYLSAVFFVRSPLRDESPCNALWNDFITRHQAWWRWRKYFFLDIRDLSGQIATIPAQSKAFFFGLFAVI